MGIQIMTVKEDAKQIIDALPEEATLDDVVRALYVKLKFQHGEEQIRAGQGILQAEAKARLEKWVE